MKKILFVIDDITKKGGTERITITLAEKLMLHGIPCEIFSLNKENKESFYEVSNVKIIYGVNKSSLCSKISAIKYAKLNNLIMVVVSMGRLSLEMVLLARLALFKEIYCYEHVSFESFSIIIQKLKLFAYKFSKGVVFLTQNDVTYVKNKIRKAKICAIDNISPYENYVIDSSITKKNIVLAIGRFTYQKNFERLISLWCQLPDLCWKLQIIGDGENKESLRALISKNKINNIEIIPSTNRIEEYYSASKILVMTSRYEGLPMVLIESLNFGIPAIAFDCKTGPREIIQNNITGYVIAEDDDKDFIYKLQTLMNEPEKLYQMSINAKKYSSRFTFQNVKSQWVEFLELKE